MFQQEFKLERWNLFMRSATVFALAAVVLSANYTACAADAPAQAQREPFIIDESFCGIDFKYDVPIGKAANLLPMTLNI